MHVLLNRCKIIVLSGVLCVSSLFVELSGGAQSTPPNFMIIIADDMTFNDVGFYGGQNVATPNIDSIASEGLKMLNFYSPAPTCSPLRHALYNGLYPVRSGAHPNHAVSYEGTRSIPHYLVPLGYRVALVGKTHVEPKENYPFEYLDAHLNEGRHPDTNQDVMREFIFRNAEQPWCLVVASHEPHSPWTKGNPATLKAEALKLHPYLVDTPETREDLLRYYAEIIHLDNQVGDFLQMLDDAGMTENTVVMFFSEQGAAFPFAKWSLYDAGIRVAAAIRWPGVIEPESISQAMVQYIDVLPTLIEMAGGEPPLSPLVIDGLSFRHVLQDPSQRHREYVFSINTSRGIINGPKAFGSRAIRDERYKLIFNTHPENTFSSAIDKSDYFQSWERAAQAGNRFARRQVNAYRQRPEWEFYDTVIDPYEMKNRIEEPFYQETIAAMKVHLHQWMQQQGDLGRETEMDAINRQRSGAVRRNQKRLN